MNAIMVNEASNIGRNEMKFYTARRKNNRHYGAYSERGLANELLDCNTGEIVTLSDVEDVAFAGEDYDEAVAEAKHINVYFNSGFSAVVRKPIRVRRTQ